MAWFLVEITYVQEKLADVRPRHRAFLQALAEQGKVAIGGPLGVVRTGDEIKLDVASRRLELCITDHEIKARLAQFTPPAPQYTRGYGRLFLEHVTQANLGCDFDFLMK